MKLNPTRFLVPVLAAAAAFSTATVSRAADPLVLISSFATGTNGAIEAFRLDPKSGRLTHLHRAANVENSYFMTVSADQKFLYAIHAKEFGAKEHEQVAAYAIARATGRLTLLNRQSTHGSASCYLHLDATGKTLLLANYSVGSVASLPVRKDGSLGEAVSIIPHAGTSVNPERQEGPHAHCIITSPDNRFACAADLGLDQVLVYRLDAAAAKLTPHDKPYGKTPPGAGPRHMVFHPGGKRLYVINELTNSITVFDYDPPSAVLVEWQTISTLPQGFRGTSACADVKITPNGRVLYGTNRGHDSIAAYRIGEDGRLTLIDIVPSLGKEAQNLAITPDGKLLLCANLSGNNVAVFRIDSETGGLTSVGPPVSVTSPSCIRVLF
ncbi:MAG: lactonase family protein [Verrucomicrobia bacterium]|nr:lactonase family protein [Verrucomicrobiota bacterium]